MIADALLTFADNTPLNTGAAGNYVIGDQIDLVVERNIGVGIGAGQLYLVISMAADATSGGSATASFSLITSDNSDLSNPTILLTTPVVPVADLDEGYRVAVVSLPISDAYKRYLGLRQTTGTAAFTGGSVNAFLTTTPPANRAYPAPSQDFSA